MKSKWTTYMLVAAAAAVWGVIAWRIFFRRPDVPVQALPVRAEALAGSSADTLLLNYRDPFSGALPAKAAPAKAVRTPKPVPVKPPVVHNLRYLGSISSRGRRYALIEIDCVQHTLAAGETADGYRLERIFPDSVRLRFGRELCCVKVLE